MVAPTAATAASHCHPGPHCWCGQPIASGKFYVCIRNWIFALVMEMRKLQLDLFFTGSLLPLPSLLSPTLSLEFSSFFLWASECAGQKKTVFGNSLGKLFEFPSFIFGLLLSPHWVFRFFGFVHLLFGLLWFPNPLPGGEVWDIYSACLMLIRFGS